MVLYAETSAILSWLFGESKASEVLSLMGEAEEVFTSVLSLVEVRRAIARAEGLGLLRAAEGCQLRGLFESALGGWALFEITKEVRDLASGSFPVEPLRTLDAIHLATALRGLELYGNLELLSFDRRVLDNASALGLSLALVSQVYPQREV